MTPVAREALDLIYHLTSSDIEIGISPNKPGKLKCLGSRDHITPAIREQIAELKPAILGLLQHNPSLTEEVRAKLAGWREEVRSIDKRLAALSNPAYQPAKISRSEALDRVGWQIERFAQTCPTNEGYPDSSDPFAEVSLPILRRRLFDLTVQAARSKRNEQEVIEHAVK